MTEPSHSSRREFIQGKSAARAIVDLADPDDSASPNGAPLSLSAGPARFLIRVGRRAMACQFEVLFNAGRFSNDQETALRALDLVDQIERQMSVYREDSELSELNRVASADTVTVDQNLFQLIQQGQTIFLETDRAFDLTSGPLSDVWGFSRRAGHRPSDRQLDEARRLVGGQHVELDADALTIRFRVPGMRINVNSIGKGYALDRGAELIQSDGVSDFLFHGGQSSVLARGSATDAPEQGWTVGLRHPLRPERRLAEFTLQNQALGTSGSGTQCFHYQGKRYGHLLDPRTGLPAEGVLSSTVIGPSAAEADALATAFYVMGPEKAEQYCLCHPHVATVLVCPGPREGSVEVHTHGLPNSAWRRLSD